MEQITLKIVDKSDYEFLFELLKERDSRIVISHKEMPTFDEHVKFVLSEPYTNWYIILQNGEKIGSTYLSKNNEIGIFLKKGNQGKSIGKIALNMIMEKNPKKRYLANVNPENKISKNFFEKNGFKLIQFTFELEK